MASVKVLKVLVLACLGLFALAMNGVYVGSHSDAFEPGNPGDYPNCEPCFKAELEEYCDPCNNHCDSWCDINWDLAYESYEDCVNKCTNYCEKHDDCTIIGGEKGYTKSRGICVYKCDPMQCHICDDDMCVDGCPSGTECINGECKEICTPVCTGSDCCSYYGMECGSGTNNCGTSFYCGGCSAEWSDPAEYRCSPSDNRQCQRKGQPYACDGGSCVEDGDEQFINYGSQCSSTRLCNVVDESQPCSCVDRDPCGNFCSMDISAFDNCKNRGYIDDGLFCIDYAHYYVIGNDILLYCRNRHSFLCSADTITQVTVRNCVDCCGSDCHPTCVAAKDCDPNNVNNYAEKLAHGAGCIYNNGVSCTVDGQTGTCNQGRCVLPGPECSDYNNDANACRNSDLNCDWCADCVNGKNGASECKPSGSCTRTCNIGVCGADCDGSNYKDGKNTCEAWGYNSGTLSCNTATCQITGCFNAADDGVCGDDVINQDWEVCDGTDLGDQTCQSLGHDGGNLACESDCTDFDTSGCYNDEEDLCEGVTCPNRCNCSGGTCTRRTDGSCNPETGNCVYSNVYTVDCCSDSDCLSSHADCVGTTRGTRSYSCSNYNCISSFSPIENCANRNGWYCSNNVYEYRTYYCSGGSCGYTADPEIIDGDYNSGACECVTDDDYRWSLGGETAADECCGDDTNEFVTGYLTGTDAHDQERNMPDSDLASPSCCTQNNKCTYNNLCYNHATVTNPLGENTIFTNLYCNSNVWQGGDDSRNACDAIVGLNHWNLGGSVSPTTCCGDDPDEHKLRCNIDSGNAQVGVSC